MHASRLVELAAFAASQHAFLIRRKASAEFWSAEQFWALSRARVNEWSRHFKACQQLRSGSQDFCPQSFWKATEPVLEEVFLSEVAVRVWCAILATVDKDRFHGELDPIARSVFVTNLEARRRALRLLLFARGLAGVSTTSLNILRRDCEAWTDHMLARFSAVRIAQQFCFERDRFRETARHFTRRHSAKHLDASYATSLVGLRWLMATIASKRPVCAELNREIGETILSCLSVASFDGCGTPMSPWLLSANQTDSLSLDILAEICGSSETPRFDIPGGLTGGR